MPTNYNRNTETVDIIHTTDGSGVYSTHLDYFVYSLAVQNNATVEARVYFNRYSDDFVVVAAGAYKEIAVTTDYYRVEATGTGESIVVTLVRSQTVDEFLTPLFPNLYAQADTDNDTVDENLKLNPISAYGYTFTPWVASDGSMTIGDNSTMVEIEYYLDGTVVSAANSTNFYQDLYNNLMNTIQSFYPDDYVAPNNPEYSPVQGAEIIEKAKNYLLNYDNYLHEEFFGGYASLTDYDENLKLTTFTFTTGTDSAKLVTAWTVLGFTVNPGAAAATVQYKENVGDAWTVVNLTANTPQTIQAKAKYFEVTTGSVDLTFTGNFVRMIDFAPILNIVYPLGMTDNEGVPSEDYASFTQKVNEFKQNLQASDFTGRVVYFRAKPFSSQASPVRNADNILPTALQKPFRYVFEAVRKHVNNYYQYAQIESDLLVAIVWENWDHYHPGPTYEPVNLPETLEEVISDAAVTIRGLATEQEKRDFIVNMLIDNYTGPYGLGGFSVHTFGSTYNRRD